MVKEEASMPHEECCVRHLLDTCHDELTETRQRRTKPRFCAYVIHFPGWECIGGSKNFEEIVSPKVVSHIAENNYPEIRLW